MGMTGPKRGNSRRSGRGHHRPDGSINVTPFVDVLLILLVVFMVVSTALPGLTRSSNVVVVVLGADQGAVFQTEPDSLRVVDNAVFRGTKAEVSSFVVDNFSATDNFSYRGENTVPYTMVENWARNLIRAGYRNVKLRFRKDAASALTAEAKAE